MRYLNTVNKDSPLLTTVYIHLRDLNNSMAIVDAMTQRSKIYFALRWLKAVIFPSEDWALACTSVRDHLRGRQITGEIKVCKTQNEHYISKTTRWNFFLISNFDKQNKMQLLAQYWDILYMGFRATLNFRKFKVVLNLVYRIFLNFAKSCILSCLSKFYIREVKHDVYGKRQKWNFCRLCSVVCTVKWNSLYLQWIGGDFVPVLCAFI